MDGKYGMVSPFIFLYLVILYYAWLGSVIGFSQVTTDHYLNMFVSCFHNVSCFVLSTCFEFYVLLQICFQCKVLNVRLYTCVEY